MELIMAIALWCGNPNSIKWENGSIDNISKEKVNSCRQKIIKCYESSKIQYESTRLYVCARDIKLGE